MMKKFVSVLVFGVLIVMLTWSFTAAERPRVRSVKTVPPAVVETDEQASRHLFFSQFGEVYRQPEIAMAAALSEFNSPQLFAGRLTPGGEEILIYWWSDTAELDVVIGGESPPDLVVNYDDPHRVRWEAGYAADGTPLFRGSVAMAVIDNTPVAVLNFESQEGVFRALSFLAGGAVAGGDDRQKPVMAQCACFGKGAATSGCSSRDCDEGARCGRTRSCRWKAGNSY